MKKISLMTISFAVWVPDLFRWYGNSGSIYVLIVLIVVIFVTIYSIWDDGKEYGKHLQEKENNIINSIGEDL